MNPFRQGRFHHVRNRRGIALPLALIGLVVVTIIITTVLLTSTTEVALSNAHRDATRDLYLAESAVESYIETVSWRLEPVQNDLFTPPGSTEQVSVDVVRLEEDPSSPPSFRIYSVSAEREGGGRTVMGMIRVPLRTAALNSQFSAAVTSGANSLSLGGNSLVSGVQDRELCEEAGQDSVTGVALSDDVDKARNDIQGAIEGTPDSVTTTMDRYEIADHLLGGLSPQQMAQFADIKFGFDGAPAWSNGTATSEPNRYPRVADYAHPQNTPLNWGCPADVLDAASSGTSGSVGDCSEDGDHFYYPVVAIDAGGGKASLQGNHGQGILLVLNGSLEVTGSFAYKGIIISEGGIKFGGTGGAGVKIEGAVLALGDPTFEETYDAETYDNTRVGGNVTIRFNQCAIDKAQDSYNGNVDSSRIQEAPNQPTYNWTEVVRQ